MKHPSRGPFSDNYWRDWIIYHGGFCLAGIIMMLIGYFAQSFVIDVIGAILVIAGSICGLGNYLVDRNFE